MSTLFNATLVRKPIARKSEDWQETSFQWKVQINGETFDFYTGAGWVQGIKGYEVPKKPTLDDVLYCLVSDAEAGEMSFDEWCDNFGYDNDSRKALAMYLQCQENAKKIKRAGINIESERERLQDY